eukprot:TRINITY_DN17926_c0_g1_i2.p1 TRINITY_DN17926_c0_g1~~TRINITY_DN17926_c0_g1_i2.p1  ORF type:complete len:387 (-),score=111.51 TRINITY_DN17926_c0_g1_i2:63-1223(-)
MCIRDRSQAALKTQHHAEIEALKRQNEAALAALRAQNETSQAALRAQLEVEQAVLKADQVALNAQSEADRAENDAELVTLRAEQAMLDVQSEESVLAIKLVEDCMQKQAGVRAIQSILHNWTHNQVGQSVHCWGQALLRFQSTESVFKQVAQTEAQAHRVLFRAQAETKQLAREKLALNKQLEVQKRAQARLEAEIKVYQNDMVDLQNQLDSVPKIEHLEGMNKAATMIQAKQRGAVDRQAVSELKENTAAEGSAIRIQAMARRWVAQQGYFLKSTKGKEDTYRKYKEMLQMNAALSTHIQRSGLQDRFVSHLARQLIVSSNIIAIQCLEAQRYSLSLQVLKPALGTLSQRELRLADKNNLLAMTKNNLAQVRDAIGVDENGVFRK